MLLNAGSKVISFDYSNSIDVVQHNLSMFYSLLVLFQADMLNLPLKKWEYSKVICLGVLQHTKNPRNAFMELSSLVAQDGEIVIDIYKKTFTSIFQWKYLLRLLN